MIVKHCQSVIKPRLSSIFARNQVINDYSSFKPVDIEEIRTEFRAYGNGRIDFNEIQICSQIILYSYLIFILFRFVSLQIRS